MRLRSSSWTVANIWFQVQFLFCPPICQSVLGQDIELHVARSGQNGSTTIGVPLCVWKMRVKHSAITYMPPIVTVAQVRSEKAGVLSPGPVAALM